MEENNVESNNKSKIIVTIIIFLVFFILGETCYIVFGLNNEQNNTNETKENNAQNDKDNNTSKIEEEISDEEDSKPKKYLDNQIITSQTYDYKLNGKNIKVTFVYTYQSKANDGSDDKHVEYKVMIGDKFVDSLDGYIYVDDEEIDADEIQTFAQRGALKTIVDNKGKEYLLLDLDGGSPLDASQVYIIGEDSKLLLDMYIDENMAFSDMTGSGKEIYYDGESVNLFVIQKDRIYYLEPEDLSSKSDSYVYEHGVDMYSHIITIDAGKIKDAKYEDKLHASGMSGGDSNFVTIKNH